jgi:hypothetical protein
MTCSLALVNELLTSQQTEIMADVNTQTDTELLDYIAVLQTTLHEAHATIAQLKAQICKVEKESSDYHHSWMMECQYSSALIRDGAEPATCESQVPDWHNSSPYHQYHDYCMCDLCFNYQHESETLPVDSSVLSSPRN